MSLAILSSNLYSVSHATYRTNRCAVPKIVGHDDNPAAEGIDGICQTVDRWDVQAVCRLILSSSQ